MTMWDLVPVLLIVAGAAAYIVHVLRKSLRQKSCAGCASADKCGVTNIAVNNKLNEIKPLQTGCPACRNGRINTKTTGE